MYYIGLISILSFTCANIRGALYCQTYGVPAESRANRSLEIESEAVPTGLPATADSLAYQLDVGPLRVLGLEAVGTAVGLA